MRSTSCIQCLHERSATNGIAVEHAVQLLQHQLQDISCNTIVARQMLTSELIDYAQTNCDYLC